MAEFYAELTQKGKELTIVSNDIPNQFSSDIPIKINKDSAYATWLLIPYVVQSTRPTLNFEVATQGIPLKYEASTGKVVLPEQSFYIGGFTFISCALVNPDTKEIVYTNAIMFQVQRTLGTNTVPNTQIWANAVVEFVDQFMNQNYTDEISALIQEAQEQQSTASSLQSTVNGLIESTETLQTNVNAAVQTANTASSNASQAVSTANAASQTANQASEAAQSAVTTANQASSNASEALELANTTNQTINQKVANGDFIPEFTIGTVKTGAAGSQASATITGDKETPQLNLTIPKGDKGDGSGNTTVNYNGAQQNVLNLITRTAKPSNVKVQLKSTSGTTFYVETSADNVYLTGSDGTEITQDALNDMIGQFINLVAFYTADPSTILTNLAKYISNISLTEDTLQTSDPIVSDESSTDTSSTPSGDVVSEETGTVDIAENVDETS